MTFKPIKIVSFLLAIGLIAALVPACGCSSKKSTASNTSNSTCPTTVPQASSTQPQSTTPSTQGGTSASEAALAQAKAEGKPVLIKFGSGKCIPCKQIEENIASVKPEYEGRAAFIIVDVYNPQDQNLTNQYGIQVIPTTFFLAKDGSIANSVQGVMTPDQIKQQLNTML